jgi:phosphohistidine phosphatase
MELYIMRHGDAVDPVTGGHARDADRPLTDEGREETVAAAGGLARLGLALDLLLTSPLVRARQTAEAVAAVLAIARGPELCPDLAPGGDLPAVLAALGGSRRAMVIGHMPGLGQLVGLTVWGEEAIIVPFRTAGVARVDWGGPPRPGEGDLRWLLTPRLAARLR